MHCSSFQLDFEVDMNGKRYAWQVCVIHIASSWSYGQKGLMRNHIECAISDIFVFFMLTLKGIAKLPFIDEARLLAEVATVEHTLTVWYMNLA